MGRDASIAVGSESFVREVQRRLGIAGKGREVESEGNGFVLRESGGWYESGTEPEGKKPSQPVAPNLIPFSFH